MNGARATAIATPMSSKPSGVGPSQGARSATARCRSATSGSRPRMPALIASTHASGAVNAPRSGPTASSSAWSVSKRPTPVSWRQPRAISKPARWRSPARSAWRTVGSRSPCSAYQSAARRWSSGTSPGDSLVRIDRRTPAKSRW